ncbi:MAG: trypsin-like peptidase domain-containing protein [Betaproteobacteria bacterium]|nr:trypsin-like peptidase domain-containing protein [Betaproteobacteria bacterium]
MLPATNSDLIRLLLRTVAGAAASCTLVAAHADNSERIFRDALSYTVQVRTTVTVPFDGDRKGSSLGAGFMVDASRGWIMTNAHVVSRSPSRVEVAFHGREFQDAQKLYVDPFLDLALVSIGKLPEGAAVVTPALECQELPPVGHSVGAFGHPWRLPYTGTRGIVSGVTNKYETELLQTDAPINQGNSGGPLISLMSGKIVGINTASIVARGAQNTNFAVAMKYACRVLALLQNGQDPSPPQLSVIYFKDLDNRKVLKVARNYLASGAIGLKPGDVIREAGNSPVKVENETQLIHVLRGRLDQVRLKVERTGEARMLTGTIPSENPVLDRTAIFVSGVLFGLVAYRDLPEIGVRGLTVHYVERGSVGEAQEIEKGDLLESVDGTPVATLDELSRVLAEARKANRPAVLALKRVTSEATLFTHVERNLPIAGLRTISARETE